MALTGQSKITNKNLLQSDSGRLVIIMYQHKLFHNFLSIVCQESTALNVPWKAAALPRCMATDSL